MKPVSRLGSWCCLNWAKLQGIARICKCCKPKLTCGSQSKLATRKAARQQQPPPPPYISMDTSDTAGESSPSPSFVHSFVNIVQFGCSKGCHKGQVGRVTRGCGWHSLPIISQSAGLALLPFVPIMMISTLTHLRDIKRSTLHDPC
jgi:hypothetical protein